MYRKRFGLIGHPLPKDAQGKTFCELEGAHQRLRRAFTRLLEEPGLAILTGEAYATSAEMARAVVAASSMLSTVISSEWA